MFMGAKSHRVYRGNNTEKQEKLNERNRTFNQQTNSPATPAPVERVKKLAGFSVVTALTRLLSGVK